MFFNENQDCLFAKYEQKIFYQIHSDQGVYVIEMIDPRDICFHLIFNIVTYLNDNS